MKITFSLNTRQYDLEGGDQEHNRVPFLTLVLFCTVQIDV